MNRKKEEDRAGGTKREKQRTRKGKGRGEGRVTTSSSQERKRGWKGREQCRGNEVKQGCDRNG